MLIAVCTLFISSVFAQTTNVTDTIKVYGECGMCQNRIQKVLKVKGVSSAIWDTETKLLIVSYNPDIITNDDIQRRVALAGHDTDKFRATDQAYNKLPGCCMYQRKISKLKN